MTMPGDITFQSGDSYFGGNLTAFVKNGTIPEARVDDMGTSFRVTNHLSLTYHIKLPVFSPRGTCFVKMLQIIQPSTSMLSGQTTTLLTSILTFKPTMTKLFAKSELQASSFWRTKKEPSPWRSHAALCLLATMQGQAVQGPINFLTKVAWMVFFTWGGDPEPPTWRIWLQCVHLPLGLKFTDSA